MKSKLEKKPEADGCEECRAVVETPDVPHTETKCRKCGRTLRIVKPGKHGIGVKIEVGDRFTIPAGFMKAAFNPLKGNMRATRAGIRHLAEMWILEGLLPGPQRDKIVEKLEAEVEVLWQQILRLPDFIGLDTDSEEVIGTALSAIQSRRGSNEALCVNEWVHRFAAVTAYKKGDTSDALWALQCAERFRMMRFFNEQLEEIVWMGHTALAKVADFINLWPAHAKNADEGFWQEMLKQHSFALSQAFSAPLLFVAERAYVGGTQFDGKDARLVDYLFRHAVSEEGLLIEIKTPATQLLLKSKYRAVHAPSAEITGAVTQLADYRRKYVEDFRKIASERQLQLESFSPRCLLIVGNGETELDSAVKRRSFELFRTGLRDVEVITFDELFKKVGALMNLFNLGPQPPQAV